MRGYFAIGAERMSKPRNLGAMMRTANAFGASFLFTIAAHHKLRTLNGSDTSKAGNNTPLYEFDNLEELLLPKACQLVGVELTQEAIELPSFRHPSRAAYIFGPEWGSLSDETLVLCDHVVKIPTKFCINVSVAAALIMYDRMQSLGNFPDRPVGAGGPDFVPEVSPFQKAAPIRKRRGRYPAASSDS